MRAKQNKREQMTVCVAGQQITVNNSLSNNIIIFGNRQFDNKTQQAVIEYKGYKFDIGPLYCEITTPSGRVTGSSKSTGYGSRCYHVTALNKKVSLSRLWCIVRALENNVLSLQDIDKTVHNHLNNLGKAEATIDNTTGLDIENYELCSYSENKLHGDAWNIVYNTLGKKLTFSVNNKALIEAVLQYQDDANMIEEIVNILS